MPLYPTTLSSPLPSKASCVTITDSNFFIAVYTLILSMHYHQVQARTHVLSVGLTPKEKEFLKQFPGTEIIEARTDNPRGPACRKGEAIMAAAEIEPDATHISLFDGDSLVTGNITKYLTPEGETFFARIKTPIEDGNVFARKYEADEHFGSVPRKVLQQWKTDVGERTESAITQTVCGGNLTVHRKVLPFVEQWQNQINKVLPANTLGAHNFSSLAYSQVDESVLNSLLAFAHNAPVCKPAMLNIDPAAYLAHLGPNHPKPWVLWRPEKLHYYPQVAACFEWAKKQGFNMPIIPWTFKRSHKPLVRISSHAYGTAQKIKQVSKKICAASKK